MRIILRVLLLATMLTVVFSEHATAQQAEQVPPNFELAGTVTQRGYGEYSVRIWNEGQIMHIDYPELKCGGTVILRQQTETVIEFEEALDHGAGTCGGGGFITITQTANDQWNFEWSSGRLISLPTASKSKPSIGHEL